MGRQDEINDAVLHFLWDNIQVSARLASILADTIELLPPDARATGRKELQQAVSQIREMVEHSGRISKILAAGEAV